MLVELERFGFSFWISFQPSGCLFVVNGQVTLSCMSLHRNKCCGILLLPAMTNIQSQFEKTFKTLKICVFAWKRNIKMIFSPYSETLNFSAVVVSLTRSLNKH